MKTVCCVVAGFLLACALAVAFALLIPVGPAVTFVVGMVLGHLGVIGGLCFAELVR